MWELVVRECLTWDENPSTIEYSIGSSEVTSDTDSVTTVNEDSSVEESSVGSWDQ